MKILITGAAGFIGYSLAKKLVKKHKVVGIDNVNPYYSVKLKKDRLKDLGDKNFIFHKMDLKNQKAIDKLFAKYKFDCVFNFAAQAGVLYSTRYPRYYLDSNTVGFFNIVEACDKYNVTKLFYASSSSVYGNVKKFPVSENTTLAPENYYGLTKKHNEEVAETFSKFTSIQFIGLRFFTVYGPWGRPDMVIYKMIDSIFNKTKFYLNNNGNHYRDFTYIDDLTSILEKLLVTQTKKKNIVFNLCTQKPIKITEVKDILEKQCRTMLTDSSMNLEKREFQQGDVLKSHGSNKLLTKCIGKHKFTDMEEGLHKCIDWWNQYHNGGYI